MGYLLLLFSDGLVEGGRASVDEATDEDFALVAGLRTGLQELEEPRIGQSYPNFYTSRLASRFVKVALSGACWPCGCGGRCCCCGGS